MPRLMFIMPHHKFLPESSKHLNRKNQISSWQILIILSIMLLYSIIIVGILVVGMGFLVFLVKINIQNPILYLPHNRYAVGLKPRSTYMPHSGK